MNVRNLLITVGLALMTMAGFAGPGESAQSSPPAGAITIADYTAFPPFLPRVVSPNILFALDYSSGMVRPAHGQCDTTVANCRTSLLYTVDDFDATRPYDGNFSNGFSENNTDEVSTYNYDGSYWVKSATGSWDGNWLNWLTATQFDVLKKVTVGGNVSPAPESANPSNMKLLSVLGTNPDFVKRAEIDKCTGKSADCVEWPTIAYNNAVAIWGGVSIIDKNSQTALPAGGAAAMVPNKLYAVSTWTDQDEGLVKLQLPFTVDYYGNKYNYVYAHTNGILGFDYDSLARSTFGLVTTATFPDPADTLKDVLAVFFQDLELGTGNIYTTTTGVAPNRVFAVTYSGVRTFASAALDTLTFQVLFFEQSNHIAFQYKDITEAAYLYTSADVLPGVENLDGSKGKSLTAGLAEGAAFFMSQHIGYKIHPNGNSPATVTAMAPIAAAKSLQITVNSTNSPCGSGYWPIKTEPDLTVVKCADHELYGLIQELRDGELSGTLGFRLGIMKLDNGTNNNGGNVVKHFNAKDAGSVWSSLMNNTRSDPPSDHAPIAEALFEASGYFQQDSRFMFNNGDWTPEAAGPTAPCAPTVNSYDPYCFKDAAQKPPCVKNFILLVSSGNYSHDNGRNIYDEVSAEPWNTAAVNTVWTVEGTRLTDATLTAATRGLAANGGWADDVAYKLRTVDIRDELDGSGSQYLPGDQRLGIYAVNTFSGEGSAGSEVLKRIARYGGFEDRDGDGNYDSGEDDAKGAADGGPDGVPDTYFQATDDLRAEIVRAVSEILKNSASGTSVSVLSTSAGGEGALYQAYFYPAKVLDKTEERRWPGYLRAFFIDRYQNLHDDHSNTNATGDSAPDGELVLNEDRVARMRLNPSDNSVVLDLYADTDGDGIIPASASAVKTETMDNIASLWEGGAALARQDKAHRNIYLWFDRDGDKVVENGSGADFGSDSYSSEMIRLPTTETDLVDALIPYLRAKIDVVGASYDPDTGTSASKEAANLIDFLLGYHVRENTAGNHQSYRNRCLYVLPLADSTLDTEDGCSDPASDDTENAGRKGRVWPLGDIVFSTPTLVAGPTERYDKIYSNVAAGYVTFRNTYQNRRNVVYVGANDGLLHAFNAGVYTQGDDIESSEREFGRFIPNPSSGNGWISPQWTGTEPPKLGEELWAFLPYDNLPHVQWLTCNGSTSDASACYNAEYTHVYYADHRPKVTDVNIFNDSTTGISGRVDGQAGAAHPHGWGTILIMPLRFGGGAMDIDDDFDGTAATIERREFRSAYYAFDITDPEQPPKLLWRFTDPNLGFSTSYPAISHVPIKDADGDVIEEKWFMIVGSGPDNLPPAGNRAYNFAGSTQEAKIFAVNLANGVGTALPTTQYLGTSHVGREVMSDATVIDVNRDFVSDVIYIGSTITPDGNENLSSYGRVYRVNTNADPDPVDWTVTKLFDPNNSLYDRDPTNLKELGPVTVGPSASKDTLGNLWVYFGTGQLRNRGDMSNSDLQRFYGIKDACWQTATASCTMQLSDLVNTTNVKVYDQSAAVLVDEQVKDTTSPLPTTTACGTTSATCSYSTFLNYVRSKKGWVVSLFNPTLSASERVISKSSVIGGVVLFTSYKPASDLCSIFGDSSLYALYYETGAAFGVSVIGSHLEASETSSTVVATNGDDYKRNASGQLIAPDGTAAPTGAEKVFDTKISLGQGMPTSIGLAVGETTTGFVQKSTGEIKQIRSEPIFKIKSGPTTWREQPPDEGGCGGIGLEMIYRHIAK